MPNFHFRASRLTMASAIIAPLTCLACGSVAAVAPGTTDSAATVDSAEVLDSAADGSMDVTIPDEGMVGDSETSFPKCGDSTLSPTTGVARDWTVLPPFAVGHARTWGTRSDDIWVAGLSEVPMRETFAHWNGSSWKATTVSEGSAIAIWGRTGDDVWAVGLFSSVYHFDGTTWSPRAWTPIADGHSLNSVWGSADELWVGASDDLVLRMKGGAWTPMKTGLGVSWWGMSGTSAADIWVVGDTGAIGHWDGSTWVGVPSCTTEQLNAIYATSVDDAWAVGAHGTVIRWDGHLWRRALAGVSDNLASVWASSPKDVWVVGSAGRVLHWNGVAWTDERSPAGDDLHSVWGAGGQVWTSGSMVTMTAL